MRRGSLWVVLGLCVVSGLVFASQIRLEAAASIHSSFEHTWARSDGPVADQQVNRTWMWGPAAHTPPMYERYIDAPDGERLVQYFDKSRMEITNPSADPGDLWFVTNGLLAQELITGEMQVGDEAFEPRLPAEVPVAGDAHPESPTYATFNLLLEEPAPPVGTTITETINQSGRIGNDDDLDRYQVTAAYEVTETGKNVSSVFWEFMNSTGVIYDDGFVAHDQLFENPFFATGFPITGAYWVNVPVGGEWQDVLIQCFERRCLTYTPANSDGWQVEAGNIGQHYYEWRYAETPAPIDPPVDDLAPPDDAALGPPIPDACSAGSQAKLDSVSDDSGNVNPNSWAKGTGGDWPGGFDSSPRVTIGQQITITAAANGDCQPLEYRFQRFRPDDTVEVVRDWSISAEFVYRFEPADVGEYLMFIIDVRDQDPRAHFNGRDDYTYLTYVVEH